MSFKRVAIIKDNKVDNVIILAEENFEEVLAQLDNDLDGDLIPCDDFEHETFSNVSQGWGYVDGKFITPDIGEPPSKEELEAALAMIKADQERFVGKVDPTSKQEENN